MSVPYEPSTPFPGKQEGTMTNDGKVPKYDNVYTSEMIDMLDELRMLMEQAPVDTREFIGETINIMNRYEVSPVTTAQVMAYVNGSPLKGIPESLKNPKVDWKPSVPPYKDLNRG